MINTGSHPDVAFATSRRLSTMTAGHFLLLAIVAACALGPFIYTTSSTELVGLPLSAPSWDHPLGTDAFGRDVLARTLEGGRVDLVIALLAVTVPFLTGTLLGIVSGLAAGSWLDRLLMRVVDAMLAFPFPILILALAVTFGDLGQVLFLPSGVAAMLVAFYAANWSVYARIARGETLALRERDFVVAARLSGLSAWTIQRRHIFPNVVPATFTYALSDVVVVIGVVASLPFLGAGVQPPAPEWGSIIYEGRTVISQAPWVCLGPGLAIVITGLSVRLIGRNSRWIEGPRA
ncbi:ABC transporter permease, partial [Nonomuraea sp. RK-328]|nr:ABC transporter permease [Nonomuraea sp. RK-328]